MSVEQEEAKKALDLLAREIHGIYGQHAVDAGLKAPKWEELPEKAKGISRDISRLVLAKMQEAFIEGSKQKGDPKAPSAEVQIPLPRSWTHDEAIKFVKAVKPDIEGVIEQMSAARLRRTSPIGAGLDAAISKITEKVALDVIAGNPEMMSKLTTVIEGELHRFLSDDDKEEA